MNEMNHDGEATEHPNTILDPDTHIDAYQYSN